MWGKRLKFRFPGEKLAVPLCCCLTREAAFACSPAYRNLPLEDAELQHILAWRIFLSFRPGFRASSKCSLGKGSSQQVMFLLAGVGKAPPVGCLLLLLLVRKGPGVLLEKKLVILLTAQLFVTPWNCLPVPPTACKRV